MRSGSPGSYSYSTIAGRENKPVGYLTFYDSVRFANWLNNGQLTGSQDSTTTEDGAYDMFLGNSAVRKAGAMVFLTSEDEWYKAAYYKGGGVSAGYWDYPAGSDTKTTCTFPGATANTANCDSVIGDLTDVGSYTGAASPSDTFDQGGNAWEWNEDVFPAVNRGIRGGSYNPFPANLGAALQNHISAEWESSDSLGFRVAGRLAPTNSAPTLSPLGIAVVLILLGASMYRRLHSSSSVS